MKKRSMHAVVLAVSSLLLFGPIPDSAARPPSLRQPAARGLPKPLDVPDVSAAYGTGTAVHADALRSGPHSLLGLDVAFSGAAFSSQPAGADFVNEVQRKTSRCAAMTTSTVRASGCVSCPSSSARSSPGSRSC